MNYLFDTDALSAFYDNTHDHHTEINLFVGGLENNDDVYIPILTIFELEYSKANCEDENKRAGISNTIKQAKSDFQVFNLTIEEAGIFGELKSTLKKNTGISRQNIKKHNMDCIIASIAIVNDCALIRLDKIYRKIATYTHLQVVTWSWE